MDVAAVQPPSRIPALPAVPSCCTVYLLHRHYCSLAVYECAQLILGLLRLDEGVSQGHV